MEKKQELNHIKQELRQIQRKLSRLKMPAWQRKAHLYRDAGSLSRRIRKQAGESG